MSNPDLLILQPCSTTSWLSLVSHFHLPSSSLAYCLLPAAAPPPGPSDSSRPSRLLDCHCTAMTPRRLLMAVIATDISAFSLLKIPLLLLVGPATLTLLVARADMRLWVALLTSPNWPATIPAILPNWPHCTLWNSPSPVSSSCLPFVLLLEFSCSLVHRPVCSARLVPRSYARNYFHLVQDGTQLARQFSSGEALGSNTSCSSHSRQGNPHVQHYSLILPTPLSPGEALLLHAVGEEILAIL